VINIFVLLFYCIILKNSVNDILFSFFCRIPLYYGSPRALYFMEEPLEGNTSFLGWII